MRKADWTDRLFEAVAEGQARPFEWGKNDCCLFTARCVDAMCGSNVADRLAGEYRDERTALQYLARLGGLQSAVTAWLGKSLPRVASIRRGDVVLFRDAIGQDALGICVGGDIATTERAGLTIPMRRALTGWRVD